MLLKDIIEFKNGKKKPTEEGNIPIFGGNGILGYTNINNYGGECLIIGRVGAYCGCVYNYNGDCWISDNAIVGKVKENNDFYYCYYLLKYLDLNSKHVGSGQPLMTQEILNNLEIKECEYDNQKKIATVLKTIDDKIIHNNELNKDLIKLGKMLYQEAFVNIENNSFEIKKLNDVTINNRSKIDSNKEYKVLSAVNTGELVLSDDYFEKQVYSKDISKYLNVGKNDFAYNPARINIGSIGLNKNDFPCCVSPVYVTFSVDDEYVDFFDLYFKSNEFRNEVCLRASGTVRQSLNYVDFGMIEIKYPSRDVIRSFNVKYDSIKNRIKENNEENRKLELLRDTLLPKLFNGEIEVNNI